MKNNLEWIGMRVLWRSEFRWMAINSFKSSNSQSTHLNLSLNEKQALNGVFWFTELPFLWPRLPFMATRDIQRLTLLKEGRSCEYWKILRGIYDIIQLCLMSKHLLFYETFKYFKVKFQTEDCRYPKKVKLRLPIDWYIFSRQEESPTNPSSGGRESLPWDIVSQPQTNYHSILVDFWLIEGKYSSRFLQ